MLQSNNLFSTRSTVFLQDPGRYHTCAHLSAELKESVVRKLHAGVSAQQIIEQHQEQWLQSFMGQHGVTDRTAAREQLVRSKPPRDFYLSKPDVENLERAVQETTWRRHRNQQCSLSLLAEAIKHNALVHQVQEPIKGTPDAEFMAARSRAAADRVAAQDPRRKRSHSRRRRPARSSTSRRWRSARMSLPRRRRVPPS